MRFVIVTLIAAGLAALPGGALAAGAVSHPQRALVVGTLSGTGSGSITVATANAGAVTISVGSHTHYLARSNAAFTAGLKVGDQLAVYTVTTAAGTMATTVQYDVKPFGVTSQLAGTLTSGAAGSLTLITVANGSFTIKTSTRTRYSLDNRALKGVATLPANEPALVNAIRMTTGETDARFVALGLPAKNVAGVFVRGSIATSGPTSLTVTTRARGTLQIAVTAGTLYVVDGTLVSSAPTITSSEKVDVVATRGAGGALTASSIWVKTH
jgi:hypothetical protein